MTGSWSDTPPIAFEHGGSVTNIAVKLDGKRPIGARARLIVQPHLVLVTYSGGRSSGVSTRTLCENLEDLKDYSQPHAPGGSLDQSATAGRRGLLLLSLFVCIYRSPAEGGVCVQRPGVDVLSAVFGSAAVAAVGGRGGVTQLVIAAHRIWTG